MSMPAGSAMRSAWRAFLIAARFLTRAPLPDPTAAGALQPQDSGRAALFYPLVGLLLGGFLSGLALMLSSAPAPLAAVLLLIAWTWGTGALHLDGLADCADAWVGGLGDRARTFEILKDPLTGTMGVVALLLVLITKWSALWVLLDAATAGPWQAPIAILLWTPAIARLQLLALPLTTPSATPQGMGAALRASLPRRAAIGLLALAGLAIWGALGWTGLWLLAAAVAALVLWRAALCHRLGGFTGDTAGALVEMTEALSLVVAVLVIG